MEQKALHLRQMLSALKAIIALIAVVVFLPTILQSQCPTSIFFSTQAEIDNFPIEYPYCEEILGEVQITGDNITNLNGLSSLTSIGGGLTIWYTGNLVDLSGLENLAEVDALVLSENDALTSISSLSNLSQIQSWITIIENPNLNSLSGLEQITTIPVWWVHISDNDNLINLEGLNNLSYVFQFFIHDNDNIIDLTGLESLDSATWLSISDNNSLDNLNGLSNLTSITQLSIVSNNELSSLSGPDNLSYVKQHISIENNDALLSLAGLERLDSVGNLEITQNNYLLSLGGLENLRIIKNSLTIQGNIYLQGLDGINSLEKVGHHLRIISCDGLTSLGGLEGLTTIGGDLKIDFNNSLQTLSGIDNIEAGSIENLSITYNPQLTTCEVQSVCAYRANPNGNIPIYVNATGCNNSVEVTEACTVGIPEKASDTPLTVYPNPFTTSTTIEYELTEPSHIQLTIYNAIGETIYVAQEGIKQQGKHSFTWSPKRLPEGMYYGVLRSEEGVSVVKMVRH